MEEESLQRGGEVGKDGIWEKMGMGKVLKSLCHPSGARPLLCPTVDVQQRAQGCLGPSGGPRANGSGAGQGGVTSVSGALASSPTEP